MNSNTNNQGIIHLAFQFGGKPFCNSRRAIMVTTPTEAHKWPRICRRCAAAQRKREERSKTKAEKGAAIISDEWDGSYFTKLAYPNRNYFISVATSGAFVGDYQIEGPGGFYSDGFTSLEHAINKIRDWEENT